MKNNTSAITLDCLIWVTAPVVAVTWLVVTFPLWRSLPPYLLIVIATVLIAGISQLLKIVMPINSPIWLMGYRLVLVAAGLLLALWRLL